MSLLENRETGETEPEANEEELESYRRTATYDDREQYYKDESDKSVINRYNGPCLSSRSGNLKKPMSYLLNEKSYQTSKIV